jgi:DNA-binding transcriptional LysR family regulator
MDFEKLRTFLEVTRQGSFSRAAEKLRLSQPAISAQIRSLEKEVGASLLDRNSGRVVATAAGRVFEPFAEQCLQSYNQIVTTVADLHRSPRGSISISANETTCLYVFPKIFAQFKRQCPRVELGIVRAERARTIEAVLKRQVDFGVISLPFKDPRVTITLVHRDELVLVVPPAHPLAERKTIGVSELGQYPLLVPTQGRQRERIEGMFRMHDVLPKLAMEVDSGELLKRLILAGLGIGFLPYINVAEDEGAGRVTAVRMEGRRFARDLALIFHKKNTLTRGGQIFFEIATKSVAASVPNSPKAGL